MKSLNAQKITIVLYRSIDFTTGNGIKSNYQQKEQLLWMSGEN